MPEGDDQWTDDEVEEAFPLGDGVAETEAIVNCPHCGEPNEIALDPGGGSEQEYVEDCGVCCRPWLMYVRYTRDGSAEVEVYSSEECPPVSGPPPAPVPPPFPTGRTAAG